MSQRKYTPRHGIDIDNVLRDFLGSVTYAFTGKWDTSWSDERNGIVSEFFGGERASLTAWMQNEAPWESMPVEDETVVPGLYQLKEAGHKPMILSATHSVLKAHDWLDRLGVHDLFAEFHFVQGSKKAHVLTDTIIDDNPSVFASVDKWDQRRGHSRLIVARTQPWNAGSPSDDHAHVRVSSFGEYVDGVINMFDESKR